MSHSNAKHAEILLSGDVSGKNKCKFNNLDRHYKHTSGRQ